MAREHLKICTKGIPCGGELSMGYHGCIEDCKYIKCDPDCCPACIEQATAKAIKEALEKPCCHQTHCDPQLIPASECPRCYKAVFKELGV